MSISPTLSLNLQSKENKNNYVNTKVTGATKLLRQA